MLGGRLWPRSDGEAVILLASKSPQRRALLEALGLDFEVQVPEIEEEAEGDPRQLVVRNATRKAEAVAAGHPDALVIAGDTEVVIDGEVLGQPESEDEARAHLQRLSASEHHVLGGLALIGPGGDQEPRTGVDVSTVAFRELDDALLDRLPRLRGVARAAPAPMRSRVWARPWWTSSGVTSPTSSACRSASSFGWRRSCWRSGKPQTADFGQIKASR